ncbi:MAG: prephenate dehydrogenase dimerization domain-containing protein, partial [Pseudomonadota bacterium]
CPAANERARALFAATMATPIDMDVDEHDRMIAFVLGLSHATGIAFVDALANSGLPGEALMALSSPTYDALLGLGRTLVHENPELYFEIQSLNDFGSESLSVLRESIGRLAGAVDRNDVHAFVSAMQAGRQFVGRHDRAYGRSG